MNIGGFIRRGESAALFVAAALAVLTCHAPARAQPPNEANRGGREESWSFFGGYTAYDLAAPGLHLGAEYPMGITPRFRSLASFAFQGHAADTQSGYALVARWGHRYTACFGLTFESYLGVGLQLPAISWGLMISVAQQRIITAPYLLVFPGIFLSVTVFSFILMGDALRDALDPKLR